MDAIGTSLLHLDDRTPYAVAAAVVRTIAQLSNDLKDEEAVWQAFGRWRGVDLTEYIRAVRRTQHSLFYYQIQHLYEFGIERVPAQFRENFCFLAGQNFTEGTLDKTIHPILQVALAQPEQSQATVVDMIRSYLYQYVGNKYQLGVEFTPDEVVLTIEDRFAEAFVEYLRQYDLNPDRCSQNSFLFISGCVAFFVSQVVKGYQFPPHAFQMVNRRGLIHLRFGPTHVFDYERLLQTLLGFIQQVQTRQQREVEESQLQNDLVVASLAMRETWEKVRRASRSDELVLLLGETGTGKTFIAQKVHALSGRSQGPFIQVGLTADVGSENLIQSNLFGHERGAFTGATEQKQGLFSLADGGTILLDEIGDASPELQAKLLRVIETSTFKRLGGVRDIRVNVRVIAATHRPLETMVRAGNFRQDLYYRLNVIPIHIPPLREQPDSIPALATFLLNRITRSCRTGPKKAPPSLMPLLQQYAWPGNIRELEHALRHAVTMSEGETLKLSDFPAPVRAHAHGPVTAVAGHATAAEPINHIINTDALRLAIRACDPKTAAETAMKSELPCHIDFARKAYLAELIRECRGDLSLIGHYWDHHSEKTLRNLIIHYGLLDVLQAARRETDSRIHDFAEEN